MGGMIMEGALCRVGEREPCRGHSGHMGTVGRSYITLQLLYIKGVQEEGFLYPTN